MKRRPTYGFLIGAAFVLSLLIGTGYGKAEGGGGNSALDWLKNLLGFGSEDAAGGLDAAASSQEEAHVIGPGFFDYSYAGDKDLDELEAMVGI